tara:strand:- start:146 stop:376 length:231 start_codon:yes stop_codon:yes gene_type:complete
MIFPGVLGFTSFSEQQPVTEEWQTGFIHWKAFLELISSSILFGSLAGKSAKYLLIKLLERIFCLVMVSVTASLFFG